MADAIYPEVWGHILQKINLEGEGIFAPPMKDSEYGFLDQNYLDFVKNKSLSQTLASFIEPINYDSNILGKIPAVYIQCEKIHFLDNMKQRAEEMGIVYLTIDTGHFPMIENPDLLFSHIYKHI